MVRFLFCINIFLLFGICSSAANDELDEFSLAGAKYLSCVDAIASLHFFSGMSADGAVKKGLNTCQSEQDDYIIELVPFIENRIGSSLTEEEIIIIREKLVQKMQIEFEDTYSKADSDN